MKMNKFVKTVIGYERMKVQDFYTEAEPYRGETVFVAQVELYKSETYRWGVRAEMCVVRIPEESREALACIGFGITQVLSGARSPAMQMVGNYQPP